MEDLSEWEGLTRERGGVSGYRRVRRSIKYGVLCKYVVRSESEYIQV
jgi:hypothetical protein